MSVRITEAAVAELHAIAETKGLLTAEAVLDAARNKASALHPLFTWDTKRAAELRRLDEARAIIMSVKVRFEVDPAKPSMNVRAFVSLASDRVAGGGYRPIKLVMEDPRQREQLLRTAIEELSALRKRYEHLQELAKVFAELEEVKKAV